MVCSPWEVKYSMQFGHPNPVKKLQRESRNKTALTSKDQRCCRAGWAPLPNGDSRPPLTSGFGTPRPRHLLASHCQDFLCPSVL